MRAGIQPYMAIKTCAYPLEFCHPLKTSIKGETHPRVTLDPIDQASYQVVNPRLCNHKNNIYTRCVTKT